MIIFLSENKLNLVYTIDHVTDDINTINIDIINKKVKGMGVPRRHRCIRRLHSFD
jgi:hypothetical protein